MIPSWARIESGQLQQGDLLPGCAVPVFPDDYAESPDPSQVGMLIWDLIVMTHSCDLENEKVDHVSLCPVHSLNVLAGIDGKFEKADERENIRRAKYEALHMLATPGNPTDLEGVLIVDFRRIFSLPVGYLKKHAGQSGPRSLS